MKKSALFIFTDGVEELELIAPVDYLRRAGVVVTLASMSDSMHITSRGGITFHADQLFSDLELLDSYDMLVIPGGPGVITLREQGTAAMVAADFFQKGKWIAAICAAPLILKDAGLIDHKKFTTHHTCREILTESITTQAVVEDGTIITSPGPGTAVEFALTLVEILCGKDVRAELVADTHVM